jgi:hypothetical protein
MFDALFMRRRGLGHTSVTGIINYSKHKLKWVRGDTKKIPDAPLYIRWGCTDNIPIQNVLNTSESIHKVNSKGLFRKAMVGLCTDTFYKKEELEDNFPIVIRPPVHSRGRHVYKVNNMKEAASAILKCGVNWYANKYVNKTNEYRVFVVQGRAVAVVEKTPGKKDDIAWNVAQGGRFDNINWDLWPLKAVKISIEAFKLSGLTFGGVDVMKDVEGNCYVLEINSAPSLTSPYRQECFAKCFDYIIDNGKENIPLIDKVGGYSKFVHPAIYNRALV